MQTGLLAVRQRGCVHQFFMTAQFENLALELIAQFRPLREGVAKFFRGTDEGRGRNFGVGSDARHRMQTALYLIMQSRGAGVAERLNFQR